MVARRAETSSSRVQVRTSAVMMDETGASSRAAPRSCICRTTSRSETMPRIVSPSSETTSAPKLCSASAASSWRTVASGRTVDTALPLPRRMSLIRIEHHSPDPLCPPHARGPICLNGRRSTTVGEGSLPKTELSRYESRGMRPAARPAPARSASQAAPGREWRRCHASARRTSCTRGRWLDAPRRPRRRPAPARPPGSQSPARRPPGTTGRQEWSLPHLLRRLAVILLQRRPHPRTSTMQQYPLIGDCDPEHLAHLLGGEAVHVPEAHYAALARREFAEHAGDHRLHLAG